MASWISYIKALFPCDIYLKVFMRSIAYSSIRKGGENEFPIREVRIGLGVLQWSYTPNPSRWTTYEYPGHIEPRYLDSPAKLGKAWNVDKPNVSDGKPLLIACWSHLQCQPVCSAIMRHTYKITIHDYDPSECALTALIPISTAVCALKARIKASYIPLLVRYATQTKTISVVWLQ